MLRLGGSAVDAVQAAVIVMEESPFFNAGRGAVLNAAGEHELDASIMEGREGRGAGVAAVRRVRNPVRAARALMDDGRSVLMAADAADAFAQAAGLDMVDNNWFTLERQRESLRKLQAKAQAGILHMASEADKHGTVGAVALDVHGDLAAATSTGGFNNKPVGRIGDSPVLGAGTYARNGVCAVSGTGQGEYFLRCMATHEVACRMMYAGSDLHTATHATIHETLSAYRIGAGMIAIDAAGHIVAPFNTLGMYRGWISIDGDMTVATHQQLHPLGRVDP